MGGWVWQPSGPRQPPPVPCRLWLSSDMKSLLYARTISWCPRQCAYRLQYGACAGLRTTFHKRQDESIAPPVLNADMPRARSHTQFALFMHLNFLAQGCGWVGVGCFGDRHAEETLTQRAGRPIRAASRATRGPTTPCPKAPDGLERSPSLPKCSLTKSTWHLFFVPLPLLRRMTRQWLAFLLYIESYHRFCPFAVTTFRSTRGYVGIPKWVPSYPHCVLEPLSCKA